MCNAFAWHVSSGGFSLSIMTVLIPSVIAMWKLKRIIGDESGA